MNSILVGFDNLLRRKRTSEVTVRRNKVFSSQPRASRTTVRCIPKSCQDTVYSKTFFLLQTIDFPKDTFEVLEVPKSTIVPKVSKVREERRTTTVSTTKETTKGSLVSHLRQVQGSNSLLERYSAFDYYSVLFGLSSCSDLGSSTCINYVGVRGFLSKVRSSLEVLEGFTILTPKGKLNRSLLDTFLSDVVVNKTSARTEGHSTSFPLSPNLSSLSKVYSPEGEPCLTTKELLNEHVVRYRLRDRTRGYRRGHVPRAYPSSLSTRDNVVKDYCILNVIPKGKARLLGCRTRSRTRNSIAKVFNDFDRVKYFTIKTTTNH